MLRGTGILVTLFAPFREAPSPRPLGSGLFPLSALRVAQYFSKSACFLLTLMVALRLTIFVDLKHKNRSDHNKHNKSRHFFDHTFRLVSSPVFTPL
jgi:hypothetical protein